MILKVICLGDIVGKPGRNAVKEQLPKLKQHYAADLVIANAENSAGGAGIEPGCLVDLLRSGVDLVTLGDHAFQRKESKQIFADANAPCIRPANYPLNTPGQAFRIIQIKDLKVAVVNLMGRVFISVPLDCPFRTIDQLLNGPLAEADLIILDMHAEATSEKIALSHYLDGRVALIFGTHTHVQTSDNQILSKGTGYITDLGMTGCQTGVIGMDKNVAIERFTKSLPVAYKVEEGDGFVRGIYAELDTETKSCIKIDLIN